MLRNSTVSVYKDIILWVDDKYNPLFISGNQKEREAVLQQFREKAKKIKKSNVKEWTKINISRCLKGLKNVSANYPQIKEFLAALAKKIEASADKLGTQAIGNAFIGSCRASIYLLNMNMIKITAPLKIFVVIKGNRRLKIQ